jgi:hypothetical protein
VVSNGLEVVVEDVRLDNFLFDGDRQNRSDLVVHPFNLLDKLLVSFVLIFVLTKVNTLVSVYEAIHE